MRRYHAQNIFRADIKLYKNKLSSFNFEAEKNIKSKPIAAYSVNYGEENFKSEWLTFNKLGTKILNADINENYTNEYEVDFHLDSRYKELIYNAELVNDSKAFVLYQNLLEKKLKAYDKELLERFSRGDESFEEEREYLIKVKEIYEEYYNY